MAERILWRIALPQWRFPLEWMGTNHRICLFLEGGKTHRFLGGGTRFARVITELQVPSLSDERIRRDRNQIKCTLANSKLWRQNVKVKVKHYCRGGGGAPKRTTEPPEGPKKREAPWSPSMCNPPNASVSPTSILLSKIFVSSDSDVSSSSTRGWASRGCGCFESVDWMIAKASSNECIRSSSFAIFRRRWSSAARTNLIYCFSVVPFPLYLITHRLPSPGGRVSRSSHQALSNHQEGQNIPFGHRELVPRFTLSVYIGKSYQQLIK